MPLLFPCFDVSQRARICMYCLRFVCCIQPKNNHKQIIFNVQNYFNSFLQFFISVNSNFKFKATATIVTLQFLCFQLWWGNLTAVQLWWENLTAVRLWGVRGINEHYWCSFSTCACVMIVILKCILLKSCSITKLRAALWERETFLQAVEYTK